MSEGGKTKEQTSELNRVDEIVKALEECGMGLEKELQMPQMCLRCGDEFYSTNGHACRYS